MKSKKEFVHTLRKFSQIAFVLLVLSAASLMLTACGKSAKKSPTGEHPTAKTMKSKGSASKTGGSEHPK